MRLLLPVLLAVSPALAQAADPAPPLLPLTTATVVSATPLRLALGGDVVSGSTTQATGSATAEVAIAARVAISVQGQLTTGDDAPVLGAQARGQILKQADVGVDLGALVRYKRDGFDAGAGEVEGAITAGRALGSTNLYVNAVLGAELDRPERDAEVAVALLTPILPSLPVSVNIGADTRARFRLGDPGEGDDADAAAGEAEHDVDATALGVASVGAARWTIGVHAGAEYLAAASFAYVQGVGGLAAQVVF